MKGYLLLGKRFHWRLSRKASGRLIKVKFAGNSLEGYDSGRSGQVVIIKKWSFVQV